MDPAWLATLPEPLRTLLIGAAGDFVGGLASDVVGRLLDAAGYQVKKRFRPTPQQLALTETLAEALVVTISRQTTDQSSWPTTLPCSESGRRATRWSASCRK